MIRWPSPTRWRGKFAVASKGLIWAIQTQDSFYVHLPVAGVALGLAAILRVELWAWAAIILAIGLVMVAELLNTAAEQLVAVLHPQHDRRIGLALDAAAAGVLFAAITAVVIGLMTLAPPLFQVLANWAR